ncbi:MULTISPECIES: NYN domain-containing protein [unclassified Yoonia]|uniref:NYN domain-containing protein n=1 Tax=unclassified Yoonia TaxID=2629118 RepID=UPI002AFF4AD4|nr:MULTISPECIES: hypothetical protein [unclassified Yoonia]
MTISDLLLLLPALIGFVVLMALRRRPVRPAPAPEDRSEVPRNAIVVDGSNVMHWGGDPSAKVIWRVLRELEAKGYTPIVFFDASVGYKLSDRYLNEKKLSVAIDIPADHICVVDKGVVADQAILAFSADHGLRIVSNDQYRDWRVHFPHLDRKGAVLRGTFQDGAVVWRRPLELVRR